MFENRKILIIHKKKCLTKKTLLSGFTNILIFYANYFVRYDSEISEKKAVDVIERECVLIPH